MKNRYVNVLYFSIQFCWTLSLSNCQRISVCRSTVQAKSPAGLWLKGEPMDLPYVLPEQCCLHVAQYADCCVLYHYHYLACLCNTVAAGFLRAKSWIFKCSSDRQTVSESLSGSADSSKWPDTNCHYSQQAHTTQPTRVAQSVTAFRLLLKYLYLSVLTRLTAQYQLQQLLRAPDEVTLRDNHIRPSVRVYLPDIPKIRRKWGVHYRAVTTRRWASW